MNVVRLSFVGSLAPNIESILISNYESLVCDLDLFPNSSCNLNEPVSNLSLQQTVVL